MQQKKENQNTFKIHQKKKKETEEKKVNLATQPHRSLLSDVTKSKQIPNTTNVNTYISTLKTMRNVPLGSESLSPQSDITAK